MAVLLLIETATTICSVAISSDHNLLALKESNERNIHSESITVFIQELIKEAGISFEQVDAIVVSKGPGSYTGLRIGVSTAKGLCFALDKPLIAIPTLQSMANGAKEQIPEILAHCKDKLLLCPMIDARRMEVYTAVYDIELEEVYKTSADIITDESFKPFLEENCLLFFGDGAEKCKDILQTDENAIFLDDFLISSQFMISLAEQAYLKGEFVDTAYFEPYYLKDFIAGKPRVKGLPF